MREGGGEVAEGGGVVGWFSGLGGFVISCLLLFFRGVIDGGTDIWRWS